MTILSFDQYIAAAKQKIGYQKTASRTAVALVPFSVFDTAGNPSGTLAVGNTAKGIVPTDALAGYPLINAFGGGATGMLTGVQFGSTVACRLTLFDCLFSAGAYAFTAATTTLASQPVYSGRLPAGTDYTNTEIWLEVSTAFVTGTTWSVVVTYTNQVGAASKSTLSFTGLAAAALTAGKMLPLSLAAGDTGVQKIQSVIVTNAATAMTAGAFNVHVMRRLWTGRVRVANDGDVHDMLRIGAPAIFDTSALRVVVQPDGTATGLPELQLEISNG